MKKLDDVVKIKLNAPGKCIIYELLTINRLSMKMKRVLLLGLGHWIYAELLKAEYPEIEEIIIIEDSQLRFLFKDLENLNGYTIIYVENNKYVEELEKINMKCDAIIMNPPYGKSTNFLYAKIFNEACKHSNHVVSLNPVVKIVAGNPNLKWQDLTTMFKNLTNVEVIDSKTCAKMFSDAAFSYNLGIIEHKDGEPTVDITKYKKTDYMYDKIWNKVKPYTGQLTKHMSKKYIKNSTMRCSGFHGHANSIDRLEYFSRNFEELLTPFKPSKDGTVKFNKANKLYLNLDNLTQLKNFYNSVLNNIYAYLKITGTNFCFWNYKKFPFLGNVKNPRTCKIGYDSDWTYEDLIKIFNLSKDEVDYINKYIIDFKNTCLK